MKKKPIEIKVIKVADNAVIPAYAHPGEDVAMDVTVTDVKYDEDTDSYIYDTGLIFTCDQRVSMFAHPRSSNFKHEYMLTNCVGIIDVKGYRNTTKAIFKHRDSLSTRIHKLAMFEYDQLPWYKKLFKKMVYANLCLKYAHRFYADPLADAPYKVGERAFQVWFHRLDDVELIEATPDEVDMNTARGTGGHGSTGK